ncbi:MAG: hypothetical protein V4567_12075, partial [Pseudomonadota bacterium]
NPIDGKGDLLTKERRLAGKKQRGTVKRNRGRPGSED